MFETFLRRLTQLRKLVAANYRMDALEARLDTVQSEMDALKSRLDVSPELLQDFLDWKMQHSIPARPLVSVCVATYNRSRLVTERCIPSILRQTYPNLELIVVGDGCTDDTVDRLGEIDDPRLTFLNLPERGHYPTDSRRRWMVAGTAAINRALSMARGDFVSHLDDDDEYLPERLEKLVEFAVTNQCDFVWHPFWAEDPTGRWYLNEARDFAGGQVTTSSVFYRSWFRKIEWDIDAHRYLEPGDWNRFRRIKYIGPTAARYPEPLVRHYRERNQPSETI